MKSTLYGVLGLALVLAACSDSTGPGGDPDPTSSNLGSMGIGDVRVLTFSAASDGLTIPATMASARYAVILGNANVGKGATVMYGVRGQWDVPSVAAAAGIDAAADVLPALGSVFQAPAPTTRGEQFEAALRHFERTRLPRPGGGQITAAGGVAASRLVPGQPTSINAPPPVGTRLTFKVLNEAGFGGVTTTACAMDGYTTTTGVVQYISQHAIIVSDINSPNGGFNAADFKAIGDEFDNFIYPTDVGYFGTPTDLDNNGHIFIYYTPSVNKLTGPGQASVSGYVGGFSFAGDLFPPTAAGCYSSNQGEIFYMLAPDPSGFYGNSFSTDFVRQVTRGTVAHEFQHMINSGNRYTSPTAVNFEATWLDEGLAHFAEDAVGRAEANYADNFTVDIDDIRDLDTTVTNAFFIQNFARAKFYVERPDTTAAIVSPAQSSANLASRGAEWALLRYAADWFNRGGDPRSLTRKLAAGPDTGTTNLAVATGVPIDTLLARFLVSLYTDHGAYMSPTSPYNFKSYNFRQLISSTLVRNEQIASYLPVRTVGGGNKPAVFVPPSSAAYFVILPSTGAARTVNITDGNGNTSVDPNGRVYIARIQ